MTGGAAAGAVEDQGQKPDDWAAGAGRRFMAIEAGSANAAVADNAAAHRAAETVVSQALCMAVLLDVVGRELPCRRLGRALVRVVVRSGLGASGIAWATGFVTARRTNCLKCFGRRAERARASIAGT